MKKGLIHIYCGDGKGKTTAAMGLAIRAAGREKKVFITQFLKSGKSGELVSLDKLKDYVTFLPGKPVNKFIWNMNDEEKKVQLLIDEDVMKCEYFGCHPCINTSSLKIKMEDLKNKIIPALGHEPIYVKL